MDFYATAFKKNFPRVQTGRQVFVVLLLLGCCLLTRIPLCAQDIRSIKVSVQATQRPLKDVFRTIQLQTGFTIEYQHDILNTERAVSFNVKDEPLSKVLEHLLAGTGTKYVQRGKSILIIKDDGPAPAKETGNQSLPGSLRGRVVDFESARPLPGASIQVEGNSGGILTDDKGYYTINHLAPGAYTLTVSYTGYQPNKFPEIKIESGKTITYDIKMATKGELQEVVVRSGAHRVRAVTYTTESQLINEIRGATAVVSGISSEMISKSADRNAAEVVRRLSGVTVVDDKFIVVRGMNQRYNITYLNGSIAPSTELYNRAFSYDMLPAAVIDRILVYKSPAANLLGDYAGGAVEVFTKNAKPVKHINIGVQAGYRPGSNFGSVINSYEGGKYDWLGIDDGTRKLSSSIPGFLESNGKNTLSQQQLLKAFSPTLQNNTKSSTPDLQLFGNYFDNWGIGKCRLYNLTSLTYTKETTRFRIYRQAGNTYDFVTSGNVNTGDLNYMGTDDQSTEKAKLNLLQNFTLKINKNHRLIFNNFLLQEGSQMTGIFSSRANMGPSKDSLFSYPRKKRITLSFTQRILYTGNIGGEHSFGHDSAHSIRWTIGYSFSRQDVPDQRVSNFVSSYNPMNAGSPTDVEKPDKRWMITVGTSQQEMLMGKISRIYARNEEQVYTAAADYAFKISPVLSLKAGTYHLFRSRLVSRRLFKIHQANLGGTVFSSFTPEALDGYGSIDYNKVNFRLDQLSSIWSQTFFPENGSGLKLFEMTTPADRYDASEQNNSGYVMGDWRSANRKWIVNAGLRIEYDQQKIAGAYAHSNGVIFPLAINNATTKWLPSVNISYLPHQTVVIRGSYGRTINRPEFRELTPYNDYDFINNELIRGNHQIITASIDNYDLRAELYPKSPAANEMLSIGIFYKNIRNPIERIRDEGTFSDKGSIPQISFINSDKAIVYGAELELRKSLAFIPGSLFRRLSLVGNLAWIKSETEKHHFVSDNEKYSIGEFSGRPLQGQAPYVINTGLFYENVAWGTKAGVTYLVNGPNIYAISIRNKNNPAPGGNAGLDAFRPSLLELPRHQVDFSFTQRLIKTLSLRLNVQNILDQPYCMVEDHNDNQRYDPEKPAISTSGETYYTGDNFYKKFNPGRYFTLTATYAF